MSRTVRTDADDDIDAAHLGPLGRRRQTRELDLQCRNVLKPSIFLEVEMVMVAGVRIEVGASRFNNDFPEQPVGGELVQRVVHGSQRQANASRLRLGVQLLGSDVAAGAGKQQAGQG